MDHSKKRTYLFSIDALRVFAIVAVVVIHVTTKSLQNLDHDIVNAPFTLFLNQLARYAVPLFFLISGFVLELNQKDKISYYEYFRKRASRILMPYLFWSILYFLIGHNFDILKLFNLRFVSDILFGTASYHLYFIPTLIIFYLIFPVLHHFLHFFRKFYILIILISFQIIISYKDYYFGQIPYQYSLRIAILNIAIFIIGMVASKYSEEILEFVKKYYKYTITSLLAVLGWMFIHVYDISISHKTTGYIYNQYGPTYYLYTFLLSINLFYFFEKTQFLKRQFILLSKLSFFVFFIHVLILEMLWNFNVAPLIKLTGNDLLKNYWFDPLLISIVCFIAFGIAYIDHRIPKLSKLTG